MGDLPVPDGQFLVYRDESGVVKLDVRLDGETVWLSQQDLADLFQTSVQNINLHTERAKQAALRDNGTYRARDC